MSKMVDAFGILQASIKETQVSYKGSVLELTPDLAKVVLLYSHFEFQENQFIGKAELFFEVGPKNSMRISSLLSCSESEAISKQSLLSLSST